MENNRPVLTFTINGVEYPLSKSLKEHLIQAAENQEDIIEAWFDGPLFNQRYKTENDTEVSVIDIVQVLETQPNKAEEMLDELDMLDDGIRIKDGGCELRRMR
jgi:hypothetical protein